MWRCVRLRRLICSHDKNHMIYTASFSFHTKFASISGEWWGLDINIILYFLF